MRHFLGVQIWKFLRFLFLPPLGLAEVQNADIHSRSNRWQQHPDEERFGDFPLSPPNWGWSGSGRNGNGLLSHSVLWDCGFWPLHCWLLEKPLVIFVSVLAKQRYLSLHLWTNFDDGAEISDAKADEVDQNRKRKGGTCEYCCKEMS